MKLGAAAALCGEHGLVATGHCEECHQSIANVERVLR